MFGIDSADIMSCIVRFHRRIGRFSAERAIRAFAKQMILVVFLFFVDFCQWEGRRFSLVAGSFRSPIGIAEFSQRHLGGGGETFLVIILCDAHSHCFIF